MESKLLIKLIFILFSISNFVRFEPAPYDILLFSLSIFYVILARNISYYKIGFPIFFTWVFLLTNILSLFFASDTMWSLRYFFITAYLCLGFIFLVIFVKYYGFDGIKTIMNGYAIAGFVTASIGLLSYFNIIHAHNTVVEGRMLSTFKDANVMGPFLIVIFLYSLHQTIIKESKAKIVWSMLAILYLICIFLSFSRGAWLNLVVSLLCYLFIVVAVNYYLRIYKSRLLVLIILLIILISTIYYFYLSNVDVRKITLSRITKPMYTEIRFERQKFVLRTFLEYPFGNGPGSSKYLNPAQHNVYLQVLYENGIPSFVIFALFFISTIIISAKLIFKERLIKKPEHIDTIITILPALIGLSVNSLFIDSLHWRHMWLVFAIPWGIKAFIHERSENKLNSSSSSTVTLSEYQVGGHF